MEHNEPNVPEPTSVSLPSKATCVVVLDLNARCHDPKEVCSKLVTPAGEFLERARGFATNIVYTVSHGAKGTALGEVAAPLKRREAEPVIYPDGFDKFAGGELQALLAPMGVNHLVLLGASTNIAVLYTATTAARTYRYDVVIPMDGVIAKSRYEQEYSFHQLRVLPGAVGGRFRFTTLGGVSFT